MRAVICCFAIMFLSLGPCLADYDRSKDWFYDMSYQERIRTQFLLVFTGDYAALVDGAFGELTYAALKSFQKNRDFYPDGILSTEQVQILHRDGLDLVKRVGFETRNDAATGMTLGIPVKLFEPSAPTRRGHRWRAYDGSIDLETLLVPRTDTAYADLFRRLTKTGGGRAVDYKLFRNDFFVVAGEQDGRRFYLRMMKTADDSRGFSLSWLPRHSVFMNRVAIAMSNSMRFFDGAPEPGQFDAVTSAPSLKQNEQGKDTALPKADRAGTVHREESAASTSGSGYFLTALGHIGTNAHVVSECRFLEVAGHGTASLVRADEINDLAIIQLDSKRSDHFVQFRANQPIVRGEEVFVFGYPFAQILDNNLNFTHGLVSSLAGVRGDIRHFMVSAPVQPGNSGGPVLDKTGALIGTVVSRLDKLKTLRLAGDLPENINFAIRGRLMATFMESLGLTPSYNTITSLKSTIKIDEEAARFTVQILCKN